MNILFVSHDAELYGAPRALLDLVIDLKKEYNINPIILVPNDGDLTNELKRLDIEYLTFKYYLCMSNKMEKKYFKQILKKIINNISLYRIILKLKKYDIDIIHSNTSVIDIGYHISKKLSINHIWHIREDARGAFNYTYNRKKKDVIKYYNDSQNIIAVSKFIINRHADLIDKNKFKLIYDGINIENNMDKKYILGNEDKLRLCIIGSINDNKNQLEVVKAIKKLIDRKYTNIILYIVGDGDKVYKEKLQVFIKNNNLERYIKFLGYIKNVNEILDNIDIGIMASKNEAFGRVTVEYMSKYIPVIGADAGGTKELIQDRVNGLLYQLGNSTDLANKIEYFINNREDLNTMGKNGYKIAHEKFNIKYNTKQIYNLYLEIYNN